MADVRGFVETVQKNYGMRPVVPFEHPIAVGDIGRIGSDGAWNPLSTTRHRFDRTPEGRRRTRDGRGVWSSSSGENVTFKMYGRGRTSKLIANVADAKARAEIEFGSSKSFVFAAKGVTIETATELSALIDAIRFAYHRRDDLPEDKRWEKDLAFVFAVGDADRMAAMLSHQAKTTVAVTGRGSVGPPAAPADLAAGINIGASSNELMQVNQVKATGRFYRAYKLNPSIFRKWDRERFVEAQRRVMAYTQEGRRYGTGPRELHSPDSFDEVFEEL
jgi:hypothetical protein